MQKGQDGSITFEINDQEFTVLPVFRTIAAIERVCEMPTQEVLRYVRGLSVPTIGRVITQALVVDKQKVDPDALAAYCQHNVVEAGLIAGEIINVFFKSDAERKADASDGETEKN